jgi:hypothetical protein
MPSQDGGSVTSRPSKFWQELADQHRAGLETLGYEVVKRRQALRYFTWSPLAFWYFGRFSFLLRQLPLATWRRCALERQRLDAASWRPVAWDPLRRWLYGFELRLLWEFAKRHGEPRVPALEARYPYPATWSRLFFRKCPVQTTIMEGAWAIGARVTADPVWEGGWQDVPGTGCWSRPRATR